MNERDCCKYWEETGKIPPMTLLTWTTVWSLMMNDAFADLKKGITHE